MYTQNYMLILLLYLLGCHHVYMKACIYLNNLRLCKGVYRHSHGSTYTHQIMSLCVHVPLLSMLLLSDMNSGFLWIGFLEICLFHIFIFFKFSLIFSWSAS